MDIIYKKLNFFLFLAIFAFAFLFFSFSGQASAATTYHFDDDPAVPDITPATPESQRFWNFRDLVGGSDSNQLFVAVGKLEFDISGLNDNSEDQRRIIVGMWDKAGAKSGWYGQNTYLHAVKKNYRNAVELKTFVQCEWQNETPPTWTASVPESAWDSTHTYHVTLEWNGEEFTWKMTDKSITPNVEIFSVTATSPYGFAPMEQEAFFTTSPLNSAFAKEDQATYNDITLEVTQTSPSPGYDVDTPCQGDYDIDEENPYKDIPGADAGDPYDYANNPYDHCSCISLTGGVAPCEDPYEGKDEFDEGYDKFPVGFNGLKLVWKDTYAITNIFDSMDSKMEAETPQPALDLNFSPRSPKQGEYVEAIVSPLNFRTRINNLYISWCVEGIGEDGQLKDAVNYNSVVAGGLPAEIAGSGGNLGPCCYPITRKSPTYEEWAQTYFGSDWTSNSDAEFDADPDGDGYRAWRFYNEDIKFLTVTPAIVGPDGITYNPGFDNRLTNAEEYVLGTDPTDPDTDDDGYSDEEDYIGVGQMNLRFKVFAESGSNIPYRVVSTVVGINNVEKTAIASTMREFFVGMGGALNLKVMSEPDSISEGSALPTEIRAIVQGEEAISTSLLYEWLFGPDQKSACELKAQFPEFEPFCQFIEDPWQGSLGVDVIRVGGAEGSGGIPIGALPGFAAGEPYKIGVHVMDPVSGKEERSDLELSAGESANLFLSDYEGEEGVPRNAKQVQVKTVDTYTGNFRWTLDGVEDEEQSGENSAPFVFDVTRFPPDSHLVKLEILDMQTDEKLAEGSLSVKVLSPSVNVNCSPASPGATVNCSAELAAFNSQPPLRYDWSLNGTRRQSGEDESSFSFNVPANISQGEKYTVSSQVSSTRSPSEGGIGSVELTVGGQGTPSAGLFKKAFDGLAKISSFIPNKMAEVFKFAAITAIIFISVIYVLSKVQAKQEKSYR